MFLLPYNVFGSTIKKKKKCSGSVAGAMLLQKADFSHFLISILRGLFIYVKVVI